MQLNHQLVPKLKQLRLSGILETLELRNRQALEEKLSYIDFLERLLEDEVERRAQKQLALRLRRASFDLEKTLEGFDFSFNASVHRQQIFELATGRFIERHENVLIQGPAGVGKSHLAQALGHEACRRGCDVLFTSASRMLAHSTAGGPMAPTNAGWRATCGRTCSSSMTSGSSRSIRRRPRTSTRSSTSATSAAR